MRFYYIWVKKYVVRLFVLTASLMSAFVYAGFSDEVARVITVSNGVVIGYHCINFKDKAIQEWSGKPKLRLHFQSENRLINVADKVYDFFIGEEYLLVSAERASFRFQYEGRAQFFHLNVGINVFVVESPNNRFSLTDSTDQFVITQTIPPAIFPMEEGYYIEEKKETDVVFSYEGNHKTIKTKLAYVLPKNGTFARCIDKGKLTASGELPKDIYCNYGCNPTLTVKLKPYCLQAKEDDFDPVRGLIDASNIYYHPDKNCFEITVRFQCDLPNHLRGICTFSLLQDYNPGSPGYAHYLQENRGIRTELLANIIEEGLNLAEDNIHTFYINSEIDDRWQENFAGLWEKSSAEQMLKLTPCVRVKRSGFFGASSYLALPIGAPITLPVYSKGLKESKVVSPIQLKLIWRSENYPYHPTLRDFNN